MTRRRTILLGPPLAVAVAAAAIAGCGGSGGYGDAQSAPAPASAATGHARTVVGVRDTALGRILVDGQGRTLYRFARDTGTRSTCSGACAGAWPPLRTAGRPRAGAGATPSAVGSSARADGARGVTYAGHPLYAYVGDRAAGDTNGDGISAFGGRWDAVTASGAVTASSSRHGS